VITREIVERVNQNQELCGLLKSQVAFDSPLIVSVLRGQRVTEQESIIKNPSAFAVVLCTPDMVFSRLLWHAYAASPRVASREAGLVGQDAYIVLDEAHLSDAARRVLETVSQHNHGLKPFWYTCMSATLRENERSFALDDADLAVLNTKLKAAKSASVIHIPETELIETTVTTLTNHADWKRAIIYITKPRNATRVFRKLKDTHHCILLTGTMRGYEKSRLVAEEIKSFQQGSTVTDKHVLICTSAGEVGLDISSDVMITEIASAERLQQRLGRLNRWNETVGHTYVLNPQSDKESNQPKPEITATLEYLKMLPADHNGTDLSTFSFYQHPIPPEAFTPAPASLSLDKAALIALASNFGSVEVERYIRGTDFDYQVNFVIRKDAEIDALLKMDETALQEYTAAAPVLNNEIFKEPVNKQLRAELASLANSFVWVGAGEDARIISADELDRMYLAGGTLYLPESADCITPLGTFEVGGGGTGDIFGILQSRMQRFIRSAGGFTSLGSGEFIDTTNVKELLKKLPAEVGYKAKVIFSQGGLLYVRTVKRGKTLSMTLADHSEAAKATALALVNALGLPADVANEIVNSSFHHDDGKAHWLWQLAARGSSEGEPLAKTDGAFHNPSLLNGMRHELVSVLNGELSDLEMWLIASHHGRCRTVFEKKAHDPDRLGESDELNEKLPFILHGLQAANGLWGLSYLEAVVRAADINAESDVEA
jgi:CRISPR-associated endonuclease/helicase Cas3